MEVKAENEKLWTKYYILIICFSIIAGIANNMIWTGIPLYTLFLGGNNSTAGLMMGCFMLTAILFRPIFGKLADTKGRRLVLLIGSAVCIITFYSYSLALSVGMLLLLRAANGIGFSANTNASGTVVSDIIPRSRLAEGIGYFGISNVIVTAIGPPLTLFIIKKFGYAALFSTAAGFGLVSLICSLFINYEKNSQRESNPAAETTGFKQKGWEFIFERMAIPPSFVMLFVAFAMGGIMSFIPIYAGTRGIEDIGVYFIVYAVALLVTRLFGGRIADRYGASTIIIPGYILLVISFIVLAFAVSIPMFVISGILYGLGLGSVQPSLNATMVRFCPADRRGAGNSTFFTAMDVGSGGGAVIWGIVSQNIGFTWVYLLCVGCIVLSWVSYSFLLHNKCKGRRS